MTNKINRPLFSIYIPAKIKAFYTMKGYAELRVTESIDCLLTRGREMKG